MIDDEEIDFDPDTVICPECGGIVKFCGGGAYECSDCGHRVLNDFGKVKEFLEKRGPSNIMEISYATGLERTTSAKMLMDGRIQVTNQSSNQKACLNCGMPIKAGKYCEKCSPLMAERKKKQEEKEKEGHSKMRFINVETTPKKKKKK